MGIVMMIIYRLVLLLLLTGMAHAQPVTGTVKRVADGDTLTVCGSGLSLDFNCVSVRIFALNTPEKRICRKGVKNTSSCETCRIGAQKGVIATGVARRLAPVGSQVTLIPHGWDRHRRIVAEVTLPDGRDWREVMINGDYGVDYPCPKGRCGRQPRPWCADE
jgi:endonuclease YncB( thermonuclease family)